MYTLSLHDALPISLGTRDHILLSQIWDFPFRRLLRLAGSRWRYSTPLPHVCLQLLYVLCLWLRQNRIENTAIEDSSSMFHQCIVPDALVITVVIKSAAQHGRVFVDSVTLGTCSANRYLAMTVFSDFTIPAFRLHVIIYFKQDSLLHATHQSLSREATSRSFN
jgi:hypothetical protein